MTKKSTDYNFIFVYVLNGRKISKIKAIEYVIQKTSLKNKLIGG